MMIHIIEIKAVRPINIRRLPFSGTVLKMGYEVFHDVVQLFHGLFCYDEFRSVSAVLASCDLPSSICFSDRSSAPSGQKLYCRHCLFCLLALSSVSGGTTPLPSSALQPDKIFSTGSMVSNWMEH